jgi:hypothetical protein
MKKILVSLILAGLLLSLLVAAPAYASQTLEGKVVIGENYTLKSGETIDGDLVVISGSATVEAGARVTGNVVVMGGSADLAGRVEQNVTVMGGSVTLRASAEVDQQLAVLGGSITREEGAQVKGGESQSFGFGSHPGGIPEVPAGRGGQASSPFDALFAFMQSVFMALTVTVLVSVLALAIAALWPESTTRVSAAIATAPAVSGLLGLLTLIAVPILLALLAITLCLAPVSLLGAIIYVAALLFGWVAFGQLLGNRLVTAFRWNLPPAGAALLGTFIVTAVATPLWFISPLQCLGIPLDTIFACLGLGGVVLTRFGSTPYITGLRPPAAPVAPVPPVAPVSPVAPVAPVAADITLFGREPEPPSAPAEASPPPASEAPAEPPVS